MHHFSAFAGMTIYFTVLHCQTSELLLTRQCPCYSHRQSWWLQSLNDRAKFLFCSSLECREHTFGDWPTHTRHGTPCNLREAELSFQPDKGGAKEALRRSSCCVSLVCLLKFKVIAEPRRQVVYRETPQCFLASI